MPDQRLTYISSEGSKPGVTLLKLDGPLTLSNIFQLQSDLRNLKPACLIMDLAGVPFMDSAGLGVIMNTFVSAQSGGRKLFVTGVNDRVRALLEMTKVDAVLKIYESIETAEEKA